MKSSLNSIFRTIWSEALGAWVAVSEITKTKGKRSSSSLIRSIRPVGANLDAASDIGGRLKPIVFAVACCFAFSAQANPLGGQVVNGQATFNTTGNTLTVTNTPGTIINWQGFSIDSNEVTHFAQQSAASSVLNRVITNNPSAILGTLSSNGRVFLVNPSGIFFGAGSTVDVAGLVATSLNLSNADFLAGRHNFTAVAGAQNISNAGNINAQQNGQVYLIAPNVENTGIINAPNGEILLVAGHSVELVNDLDPNLRVNITAPAGDATNVGQLVASAGRLGLFGTVVKNAGTVSADSATMQGGKIVFRSSQRTEVSGTASAQGVGGGEIKVLSDLGTGTVQVSGTLDASAPIAGDGGFIDTSAAHLDIASTASIKASSANGKSGEWLIDPLNVTIAAAPAVEQGGGITSGTWAPSASGSTILNITIEAALNAGTSVTVTTANAGFAEAGDITVAANITMTGIAPATLTLKAENNIIINANTVISSTNITPTALNVVLNSDSDGVGGGGIVMGTGSSIVSGGGNITLGGGVAGDGSGNAVGSVSGILLTGATLNAGGGNVVLRGQGGTAATSTSNMGINLIGTIISTASTGTISINGTGGGNLASFSNRGIRIESASSLTTATGGITLNGTGGYDGDGVQLLTGSTIQSTSGTIGITGTSGDGVTLDMGVLVSGLGTQIATGGDINIVGTSMATGTGGSNRGVRVEASAIITTASGAGNINITAQGGERGDGFQLAGTGSQILSATGNINISGTSGFNPGSLGSTVGILISGSGALISSSGGNVSLTGVSKGVAGTNNYGINMEWGSITAPLGNLTMTGAATNADPTNYGIYLWDVINSGLTTTLNSSNDIYVRTSQTPTGNMVLHADMNGTGTGTVIFDLGTASLTSAFGKKIDLYYNPTSYAAPTIFTANLLGGGTNTAWMLVNDVGLATGGTLGLQAMATNLAGNYALGKNIDATATLGWGGVGFAPVGDSLSTPFTGIFDGQGHLINGLFINSSGNGGVFGFTNGSTIKNVTLTNVNITVSGYAGGLVGRHQGTISNSHVLSGTVTSAGSYVGGLIGMNYNGSSVSNSSAGATVSGASYVGGLIGASQQSTLLNVSATGNVTGTNWAAGGLVGSMDGDISPHNLTNGTASGNVNGSRYVGGLVGWNGYWSTITNGIASGNVTSTLTDAGGLVGMNAYTITGSHATGNVTGVTNVGGLVGNNFYDNNPSMYYTYGTINNSYANTGLVTGTTNVGGLVGHSSSFSNSINNSDAGGAVTGNLNVGGLVGYHYRGFITTASASGSVTGNGINSTSLGGLVGDNSGSITDTFATGVSVTGVNNVGGLVGKNHVGTTNGINSGKINTSYVSGGSVTGTSNYGGLVGNNTGTITNSHYNINNVLINGANIVTVGGLYNDNNASFNGVGQYTDWLVNGNKSLSIGNYTSPYGSFGNGGVNIYTISNAQGLKDMLGFTDNSNYTFVLAAHIDLTTLSNFYIPVLASNFDGGVFTISNLNVNQENSYLGFFGMVDSMGTVSNVSLLDVTVRSIGLIRGDNIGGLAGLNKGTINSSSVSSTLNGNNIVDGGTNVGGLVGANIGTIGSSSVSTGLNGMIVVQGTNSVGGLVGNNSGAINTSSFSANTGGTASVTGTTNVGGLVGTHSGLVLNQSGVSVITTGVVNVSGVSNVGGLVGNLTGNIDQDYVTGVAITATGTNVGGIAGVGLVNSIYCNLGCFYNVNTVTINNANIVTPGALYNTQYNAWYNAGNYTPLAIGNYASLALQLDGSYGISSVQGMQEMLGFAHLAIYNFSLTGSVDLATLPGFYVPKLAGSFNGKNLNISNLNINLPNSDIGLFGNINFTSSVVSNLNLVNASVSGSGNVGALVGLNFGTIDNVSVTGTTSVSSVSTGMNIGGLVGKNFRGNISNSDVTGATVSGIAEVGGLVGFNSGTWTFSGGSTSGIISNSFVSNGSVTGTAGNIGGLVGRNWDGAILGSHVTNPTVSGGASSSVGGLVGLNEGDFNRVYQGPTIGSIAVYYGYISNSFVSGGTVTSTGNDVGGLLGRGYGGLVESSWTDSVGVSGYLNVGGLVGYDGGEGMNPHVGVVSNSHALNPLVTGHSHVGGLVGYLGIVSSSTNVRDNNFVVTNSYVSGGTVSSNATTLSAAGIGGLVGYNFESNISGSYVTNGTVVNGGLADSVGGLVGHNNGFSTTHGRIVGSYVNGTVVGPTAATGSVSSVGGLVGFNSGTISNSYVSGGTVGAGTSGALLYNVGGLVGSNNSGSINNSYVTGGTVSGNSGVGGLVGYNSGSISNTYVSTVTVTGTGGFSALAGGLVGYNNFGFVSNSYVSGGSVSGGSWGTGGVIGSNATTLGGGVSGNFWDVGLAGIANGIGYDLITDSPSNVGSVGLTATGMLAMTDFFNAGWSIANTGGAGMTWRIYEGQTTPLLSSFLKPLVISAAAASKTYDGAVYSGGLVNPTYTDGVNPVVPNSPDILGTANAYGLNAINAGVYAPALYSGQQGYDISYVGGMLTIGTASLSVISLNGTRVYDGTANVDWSIFTLAGLIGGQTLTLSGVGTVADANVGINKPVSLGTLALGNGTNGGLASNYTLTGGTYVATINPATLTYTANAANRTYGANNPAFSGSVTGFVLGETLATATTGTPVFTTLETNTSNVGSYALTGEGLLANNGNYTFAQAASNSTALRVTPATLTYTAAPASRMYGDANPTNFGGSVSGFVLGQTTATATTGAATFSTSVANTGSVGSYAINGSGLTANNGNYTFVQAAGNATAFSILQRGISITATATSKVYGRADPNQFTVGGNGLAVWDTNATAFTGSLSHTGGENVGTGYAITAGNLLPNSNYSYNPAVDFTSSTLGITPAVLVAAGVPTNKVLGTTDPALTYTVSGLQFSDTAATTLNGGALVRDSGETIGSYLVKQGTLDLAMGVTNYTFTYVPCNFTILAPTVVQEITQMTLQSAPAEDTATTSSEEEKKESAELLAEAAIVDDSGQPLADPLPVCR